MSISELGFSTVGQEGWTRRYDADSNGELTLNELDNMYPGDVATLVDQSLQGPIAANAAESLSPADAGRLVGSIAPPERAGEVLYWVDTGQASEWAKSEFARAAFLSLEAQQPGGFAQALASLRDRPHGVESARAWLGALGSGDRASVKADLEAQSASFARVVRESPGNDERTSAARADAESTRNSQLSEPARLSSVPALTLDPRDVKSLRSGVLGLIGNVDVYLAGEYHSRNDEAHYVALMRDAKALGVNTFAVEIPDSFQGPIESFLASNRVSENVWARDLKPLLKAAQDSGMKVVCIDDPDLHDRRLAGPDPQAMENSDRVMATRIRDLASNGKVIAWVGDTHAARDKTPYPTLPVNLQAMGLKTASVRVETGMEEETAHRAYFGNGPGPARPIAVATSRLPPDLSRKADVDYQPHQLPYAQAFDLLIFSREQHRR